MCELFQYLKSVKDMDVDIAIWTFGTSRLAEPMLTKVFEHWGLSLKSDFRFLWTGEYHRGSDKKRLEFVWSQYPEYDPSSTFIVDDSHSKLSMNKLNAIIVPKFDPHYDESIDTGQILIDFFKTWIESGKDARDHLIDYGDPFRH
ncbi:hypothetical protein HDU76_012492 [Blyttiomyces sp. JEL0837]|nr:hypothetical protein HDU76_012492 [Blyttiomyces sp. JEL0837]